MNKKNDKQVPRRLENLTGEQLAHVNGGKETVPGVRGVGSGGGGPRPVD
jgi:hypothetical protein